MDQKLNSDKLYFYILEDRGFRGDISLNNYNRIGKFYETSPVNLYKTLNRLSNNQELVEKLLKSVSSNTFDSLDNDIYKYISNVIKDYISLIKEYFSNVDSTLNQLNTEAQERHRSSEIFLMDDSFKHNMICTLLEETKANLSPRIDSRDSIKLLHSIYDFVFQLNDFDRLCGNPRETEKCYGDYVKINNAIKLVAFVCNEFIEDTLPSRFIDKRTYDSFKKDLKLRQKITFKNAYDTCQIEALDSVIQSAPANNLSIKDAITKFQTSVFYFLERYFNKYPNDIANIASELINTILGIEKDSALELRSNTLIQKVKRNIRKS